MDWLAEEDLTPEEFDKEKRKATQEYKNKIPIHSYNDMISFGNYLLGSYTPQITMEQHIQAWQKLGT